jgi:hypothetical protein
VRLEPLYRVRFSYSGGWGADLAEPDSAEGLYFFLAEGRCEGRISGRFRGANHPSRRSDGTFQSPIQLLCLLQGRSRLHSSPRSCVPGRGVLGEIEVGAGGGGFYRLRLGPRKLEQRRS